MNIDNYQFYHDFSLFGFNNKQNSGTHKINQGKKQNILFSYLTYAIEKVRDSINQPSFSFLEMYCADAFFTVAASRIGSNSRINCECFCIDDFSHAYYPVNELFKKLNVPAKLIRAKIDSRFNIPSCDIIMNAGGLYHMENPEEILQKSYEKAKRYLIVQNVVTLNSKDEDYFKIKRINQFHCTSRYSRESFDKLIKKLNYKVVYQHFNELPKNQIDDRGSVYYLIEK